MKNKFSILLLFALTFASFSCEKVSIEVQDPQCNLIPNANHPKAAQFQALLDQFIAAGVPGVSASFSSPEGE